MSEKQNVEESSSNAQPKKKQRTIKKVEPTTVQQKIEKAPENILEEVQEKVVENIHEEAMEKVDKNTHEEVLEKNEKTKKKKSDKKKKGAKKKESVDEAASEDGGFISKLQKKKKVNYKESISVTLWEDLYNIIQQVQEITGQKQNSIINHILSEIYDEKSKSFKMDIPAETKPNDKVTSFLIEEKHLKAIKKTANKLNMSSVAYFNKLILKYAQENILSDIDKNKKK